MNFICQQQPMKDLDALRLSDRHSILIEGPSGCGKTYLAMQYAKLLGISDFQIVEPKVDIIKSAVEECIQVNNPVVICIENLDTGVAAASYTLLKFLEEPTPNVYIIVTCRNMNNVPDTIISRSAVVIAAPPVESDLATYAISRDKTKFDLLKLSILWKCVRTFKDADIVLDMTQPQLDYFTNLTHIAKFSDSVSNLVWKISHYDDNSEAPVEIVLRYLMLLCNTPHIRRAGVSCLNDLASKRIASHAVLAKFIFEAKYCE